MGVDRMVPAAAGSRTASVIMGAADSARARVPARVSGNTGIVPAAPRVTAAAIGRAGTGRGMDAAAADASAGVKAAGIDRLRG